MKFAKHLETESVAEWRRAYINYKGLKRKLDAIEKVRRLGRNLKTGPRRDLKRVRDILIS